MDAVSVELFCPHCGAKALVLSSNERPIQETKVRCIRCNREPKIAQLKSNKGDTFQMHVRMVDPKAVISRYTPHLK